jgi:hypothetical protein
LDDLVAWLTWIDTVVIDKLHSLTAYSTYLPIVFLWHVVVLYYPVDC